jgi:hypothetical protein
MSGATHNLPAPTIDDVERIVALEDAVIRNLQITQCYHELSCALAERTGMSANWCTFATWASKQAGQTIRKEDLARTLQSALQTAPSTRLAAENLAVSVERLGAKRSAAQIRASIWELLTPSTAIERASEAVGRGNKKVFEEIGRQFARFLATCAQDVTFDPGGIARFCSELVPGDPPEGQSYLSLAFTHYYQSFFESDARRGAELMLMANVEIGFHEQTRLQPEIREALDAALVDVALLTRRLVAGLFPMSGWAVMWRWFAERLLGRPTTLHAAMLALAGAAQAQTRLALTDAVMAISLPGCELVRLGDDLSAGFPESLRQVTLPELRQLLERIDPTPDSPQESGALDWADLPERLHFIADLFRCFQELADLFEPPFTSEQTEALKAGSRPDGRL